MKLKPTTYMIIAFAMIILLFWLFSIAIFFYTPIEELFMR